MRRIVAAVFATLLVAACASAPDAHEPAPPAASQPAKAGGTGEVDRSCSTDADCTVKNVGNCCGYYPACVNVDSQTFPEQVKSECAREGRSSICGFPTIESCQCVQGSCQPATDGGGELR